MFTLLGCAALRGENSFGDCWLAKSWETGQCKPKRVVELGILGLFHCFILSLGKRITTFLERFLASRSRLRCSRSSEDFPGEFALHRMEVLYSHFLNVALQLLFLESLLCLLKLLFKLISKAVVA